MSSPRHVFYRLIDETKKKYWTVGIVFELSLVKTLEILGLGTLDFGLNNSKKMKI